jgi:hypothetical protein
MMQQLSNKPMIVINFLDPPAALSASGPQSTVFPILLLIKLACGQKPI